MRPTNWCTNKNMQTEIKKPHVSNNSGNEEWYTPPRYIESARIVMGSIDLDPASCETANFWIRAEKIFTKQDDGLLHKWHANVYLNPPYGQPLIKRFIQKLIDEKSNIKQAIVLVNNGTETAWGQKLLEASTAVCFPKGRIKFYDSSSGPAQSPLQGQMICYIGDRVQAFANEFSNYGTIFIGA